MRDDVDARIHDAVALAEIDLYGDVLSAVATADRRLTDAEIDEVLGITRLPNNGARREDAAGPDTC